MVRYLTIGLILCLILLTTKANHTKLYTYIIPKVKTKVVKQTNQLNDYLDAIGFTESSNNYKSVNTFGYMGRYQFSRRTLKGLGFNVTDSMFLNTPLLQDSAMVELLKHNKKILKKFITKYSGNTIKDVEVSESGILAAAHLAGPRNVKKWLKSDGKKTRKDGYGTTIEKYMNKFKNYKLAI